MIAVQLSDIYYQRLGTFLQCSPSDIYAGKMVNN